MKDIVIPENINIQLVNILNQAVHIENITVYIKITARLKNDFKLGPFFSNELGNIIIAKADFLNEVNATYDSGLMDYSSIESSHSEVEIKPYTTEEVNRMIHSRTHIWTNLLNGEEKRWKSIDSLVEKLKTSNNGILELNGDDEKLIVSLNGETDNYKLDLKIKTKPNKH